MPSKVIPIRDSRSVDPSPPLSGDKLASLTTGPWQDRLGRPLRDLRISVTDRCNFRCSYCMPKEVFDTYHRFLPQSALLSFEEITRLARIFVGQGVRKIRLTGGEPLLRKNIESLVGMLAELKTPEGQPLDLTLTTNASVLAKKAQALRDAGLQRVTVSLDALDDAVFRRMNDVDFPVSSVLSGIEAAQRVGLGPIKVNMVVQRGVNENQIVPLARHFRGTGIILRFIEYMDVGSTNQWQMDQVVPSAEVIERLSQEFPLEPLAHTQVGETAERWRYQDGSGEVGVISSVTHAFCSDCNRARLSTEGRLYTCLFAHQGVDIREPMRAGESDAELAARLRAVWQSRSDRYSELRSTMPQALPEHAAPVEQTRRVEMHYIGG